MTLGCWRFADSIPLCVCRFFFVVFYLSIEWKKETTLLNGPFFFFFSHQQSNRINVHAILYRVILITLVWWTWLVFFFVLHYFLYIKIWWNKSQNTIIDGCQPLYVIHNFYTIIWNAVVIFILFTAAVCCYSILFIYVFFFIFFFFALI